MSGAEYGYSAGADNYGYGQMTAEYGSGAGYTGSMGGRGGTGVVPPNYGGYAGYTANTYTEHLPSPLDTEIQVVCREIHGELHALEQAGEYGEQFKNARRLLTTEANKLENNIDPEWLEVDINKPIKVTKKILIPSFRHPKFNFVGKVLGPKGATLQNIAKHFKCHVYILGRGSTRDRAKENELLNSGDPQFAHYGGPLHVKVETTASPAVAYQRVAGVLDVLSQLLVPVKDTVIEGITTDVPEGEEKEGKTDGETGVLTNDVVENNQESENGKNGNERTPNSTGYLPTSNRASGGGRGNRGAGGRGSQGGGRGGSGNGGFRGGFNAGGNSRGGSTGGPVRGGRGGSRGFQPY